MDSVYRGSAARAFGMGDGTGMELKAGSSIHSNRKAAIVHSLKCTNSHSLLVRLIRLLKAD